MFAISRVFLCRPTLTSTSLLSYSTEAPIRTLLNNSEKAAKALAACKCKRMIKSAARENGPFPEYNSKLAYWIDEAKRCDVSDSTIDFSIKLTLNKRTNMGIHEITFPGKCFLVAQYEAIDSSVLASKISRTCDDFDATFVPYDSYRHVYYDPEAVIVVDGKVGGQTLDDSDKEKISMFRNVKINYEENNMGKDNIIFRCGASNLHWLKRNLTDMGYTIEEAFVGFAPKSLVKLPTKAVEKVADLLLILGEMEEVDNLYENVE